MNGLTVFKPFSFVIVAHSSKKNIMNENNYNKIIAKTIHFSKALKQVKQKTQNTLNIFDRKAKVIQRERAALSEEVEVFDYLKEEIGYRLADRIFDIKRKFNKAVDLGCSRGYVSKHVISDSVKNLIMTDNSELLLSQCCCNDPEVKVEKKVCDEENLLSVFQPESVELVISNLALHWVNNLPSCFSQVMKILKIDGVFLGSMFGIDTLYELRSSLQLAELERKGGVSPHISPFAKPTDIGFLLMSSGFIMQTIDTDEIVVRYPTIFELMGDLKGMGESNAAYNRNLHLSRETLMAASVIYESLYGKTKIEENADVEGIPATFQIIYFIGWKPDPSKPQPPPKDPTMVSLRDYYNLHKVAKDKPKKSL